MRVLICGSRDFHWISRIQELLRTFPTDTVIIEGGAKGADLIASYVGKELGMTVLEFPADWKKYGRAAGPIRNKQMLVEGKPDVVYAFYTDKEKSTGTRNMVMQTTKAGIPVHEYDAQSEINNN